MKALIDSLRVLVKQSTEALGAEDPSTIDLQRHLDEALAAAGVKHSRVFWMRPEASDGGLLQRHAGGAEAVDSNTSPDAAPAPRPAIDCAAPPLSTPRQPGT